MTATVNSLHNNNLNGDDGDIMKHELQLSDTQRHQCLYELPAGSF